MITEKSNRLQVIVITDYDYPISECHMAYYFCAAQTSILCHANIHCQQMSIFEKSTSSTQISCTNQFNP